MATVKFHKVTTLPGSLDADSFYFVDNGTYAESYLTDASSVAHSIGNSAMITTVANALITSALSTLNTVEVVADITARDLLATNDRNQLVLVLDATDDVTVASGAAMYAFRNSDNTWYKVTEYESLDVTVTWASITGKPSSSPTLIDEAVTQRHTHANKAQLDKIGESGGFMTYDGAVVASNWTTTNW